MSSNAGFGGEATSTSTEHRAHTVNEHLSEFGTERLSCRISNGLYHSPFAMGHCQISYKLREEWGRGGHNIVGRTVFLLSDSLNNI